MVATVATRPLPGLAVVCAWCGRLRENNRWIRAVSPVPDTRGFSHSICPRCFTRLMRGPTNELPPPRHL